MKVLSTQTEIFDERAIAGEILSLEIIEQTPPLTHDIE